jgi:hypothetical protein
MKLTHPLYVFFFLLLLYVLYASLNYDQEYLYHDAVGREHNAEYNLLKETNVRKLSRYDRFKQAMVNLNKGLFSIGPGIQLQKGYYDLTFEMIPYKVDPQNPYISIIIHQIDRNGSAQELYGRTLKISEFIKEPRVKFKTPGGPRHEFLLLVTSPKTKLGLKSLRLNPRQLDYWPYILHFLVVLGLLLLGVYALKKAQQTNFPVQNEIGRTTIIFLAVFTVYALVILQPFWPITRSLSGDSPHYLVVGHYIAKHKTFALESLEKVYNYAVYKEFIGFKIPDPEVHVGINQGYLYPKHQFGYPLLMALPFLCGLTSIVLQRMFSALFVAVGVVYLYRILKKTPNAHNAMMLTLLVAFAPPVFFYSFAIFTEPIAFMLSAICFYHLIVDKKSAVGQYISVVLLGLLLFVKIKYIAIGLPILAASLLLPGKRKHKIALCAVFAAMFLLYEIHVYAATHSLHPFAWYPSTRGPERGLGATLLVRGLNVFVLSFGFLADQRFGIFFVAPFTVLLLLHFRKYIEAVKTQRTVLAGLVITMLYLGLNAYAGTYGGTSPAMRPQIAVWPMIVFVLFSVELDLKKYANRFVLGLSVLFTLLMFATGYYMIDYTENYSKFYEAITPYRIRLHKNLPNFTMIKERIKTH